MGSIFGGGSTKQTTNQTSGPPSWQMPSIQQGLSAAQNIYNQQQNMPYYQGELYAPDNQNQFTGIQNLFNNGSNLYPYASQEMQQGSGLMGSLQPAQTSINNFATGNFNQGQTQAGNIASGNVGATTNATDTALRNGLNLASTNSTGQNVQDASQYINNPVLQGQIDALGTDINRNLTQNQIPSLNAAAAATGNQNSSRTGADQAIYQSQAQENLLNAASNLRGQAYNNGLNLSQQGINSQIQGLGTLGQVGNYGTSTGLQGQFYNNQNNQANNQLQLSGANSGLNAGLQGANLIGQGGQLGATAAGQQYGAGALTQQNQQQQDNANFQRYEGNLSQPWSTLDQYWNVVGRPLGTQSTGTTTNTQSQSALGDILGVGSLLAAPFTGGTSLAAGGAGSILGGLFGSGGGGSAQGGDTGWYTPTTNSGGSTGFFPWLGSQLGIGG